MGNKDAGRALAGLPNPEYMGAMGATISNYINTGVNFTNAEVWKYFRLLRDYALNRCKWTSPQIDDYELRLIEWNIFHYGFCAMLKPKITRNNIKFTSPLLKIYQCNYTDYNMRTMRPLKIALVSSQNTRVPIDINYTDDEFVIFTDEFLNVQNPNPMMSIAWEFACKFHELDLAFNANSHKNRMPFVFNNGNILQDSNGNIALHTLNKGITIAELMRSAYGRNEQFVEIPEFMVGTSGFMFEPKNVENHMLEHIESQKKLYEAYFEILGLYTNKERAGVYTIKELQKEGDETGEYRTSVMKNTRLLCAQEACNKFDINLILEVL